MFDLNLFNDCLNDQVRTIFHCRREVGGQFDIIQGLVDEFVTFGSVVLENGDKIVENFDRFHLFSLSRRFG